MNVISVPVDTASGINELQQQNCSAQVFDHERGAECPVGTAGIHYQI
jgi:hypothetical protein